MSALIQIVNTCLFRTYFAMYEIILRNVDMISGLEIRECSRKGSVALTTRYPFYPQTFALTSPTRGGLSIGIVRSRTKATEFSSVDMTL
jgi:hypothetical protein